MSTQQAPRIHRIYLLTVWQDDGCQDNEAGWRFLLEDPRSGKRKGFATVQALVDGLLDAVAPKPLSSDHADNPSSTLSPDG